MNNKTIKQWKIYERSNIEQNIFNISTIKKQIEVEIDIQHSLHSLVRTRRHDSTNDIITNQDIKKVVNLGSEQIIQLILENILNIGDTVLITRKLDWLNVVGSLNLKSKSSDTILFKVITVMKEEKFINRKGTYQIFI